MAHRIQENSLLTGLLVSTNILINGQSEKEMENFIQAKLRVQLKIVYLKVLRTILRAEGQD